MNWLPLFVIIFSEDTIASSLPPSSVHFFFVSLIANGQSHHPDG
jgi:hypothetical protein